MEEKHHCLDEEELSGCSWQQEGLLVVLVDIEGETAASHGTARTAQQRYSKKAKDDAAIDHRGKMVAAIMLTERQREGMKVMAIGTERHREEERHGEKKEMVRGGREEGTAPADDRTKWTATTTMSTVAARDTHKQGR